MFKIISNQNDFKFKIIIRGFKYLKTASQNNFNGKNTYYSNSLNSNKNLKMEIEDYNKYQVIMFYYAYTPL
jgi:hypothetical protein